MKTSSTSNRLPRHIPWIAAFIFLVSLLGPMLTMAAPDDNPFDDPPPTATEAPPTCPEGEILTPNNVCIPDPNQQPACPDGQVLDGNGNCQPLPPPPCPAGMVYDQQGNCVPDPDQQPTCADGEILSPNNACIPDPNQSPDCGEGEVPNGNGGCMPDPDAQPPTCEQGTVLDPQSGQCEPVEQSAPPAATEEDSGQQPAPALPDDVPTAEPDTTTSITAALTAEIVTHPVEITKFSCPEGTDRSLGVSELIAVCSTTSGVDFTLIVRLFDTTTTTKTTDASGIVTFEEVPARSVIQESVPEGYGDPKVFCGDPGATDILAQIPSDDGAIGFDIGFTSETYSCDWFNFPGDQPLVTVRTFTCPTTPGLVRIDAEEAATPLTLEDYQTQCPEPGNGVRFILEQIDDLSALTTVGGGATWRNVPEGSFTLTETIPPDSGTPVWFCGFNDGALTHREAPGGVLSSVIGPDDHQVTCWVFNHPDILFVPAGSLGEPGESTGDHIIEIDKFSCPTGTDSSLPLDALRRSCPAASGIEFTTTAGGTSSSLTTDVAGNVLFSGIPNGPFAIQETVPEGYGDPLAYCGFRLSDGGFEASPAPGGLLEGEFVTEEDLYCLWFNFNASDIVPGGAPAETGESVEPGSPTSTVAKVILHYHVCPPTVDLSTFSETDTEGPEGCTGQQDGVTFQLVHDGAVVDTRDTGADGPSQITFEPVPTGTLTLVQVSPPPGDKVAFCNINSPEGNTRPYGFALLFESSWEFELEAEESANCDWYVTGDGDNTGRVVIQKSNCSDATLDRTRGIETFNENCTRTAGIAFSATGPEGFTQTQVSTGSGTVIFTAVPAGNIVITETIPEGYGDPVIFCGPTTSPDGFLYPGLVAPGGRISYDLSDADELSCAWFNMPMDGGEGGEGGSTVTINKWRCPAGFDFAAVPPEDWPSACADSMSYVDFTLTDSTGPELQTTVGGFATWRNVSSGDVTLTEDVPQGFDSHTFASCSADGAERRLVEVTEGTLTLPPIGESEAEIVCDWYNVPFPGPSLLILKYECPEGVEIEETPEAYQAVCTIPMNGVDFTLTDFALARFPQSTSGGVVEWNSFEPGVVSIREAIPPGFSQHPFVVCATGPGGWEQLDATTGRLYKAIGPDEIHTCRWYNVPAGDDGDDGFTITVRKFICPEDMDPEATDRRRFSTECTVPGDGIEFTLDNVDGSSTKTVTDGVVQWTGLPAGDILLTETERTGSGETLWYCGYFDETEGYPFWAFYPSGPTFEWFFDAPAYELTCNVYNFPNFQRTVTVHKWECPVGTDAAALGYSDLIATCATPLDGIEFTHPDDGLDYTRSTTGGTVSWYGVSPGEVGITEHTPPGYLDPVAWCALSAADTTGTATHGEAPTLVPVTGGSIMRELTDPLFTWTCDFFNVSEGPGEITINKWTCPAGYDVDATGTDPTIDCTEATDRVEFTIEHFGGVIDTATTGEIIPGAVHFGNLQPDTYAITETLPDDIDSVFVWDCTGTDIGAVHPTPLSRGIILSVEVAGGDSITCDWYNVLDPESGWITVIKKECSTASFVDPVDCDTYEHGAAFELFAVDGDASVGTGTTNAGGELTWNGLAEGRYRIDELDAEPCHVDVSRDDGDGVPWVEAGEGTVFTVYNCTAETTTGTPTTSTGKIPVAYPDTGAGPVGNEVSPRLQDATGGTATPTIASDTFYEIACLDAPITVDGTPAPAGTPAAAAACVRGAIPTHLLINDASINAEVEVVEIVDGAMQPPSDPQVAAWYKETARLGEANNTIIAGHLNWWNVPEGVFFHLGELEQGDRIEVAGDDGLTYVYEVQWVRQESNNAPPSLDVVGPTDEPSLTLVTCGGEWDSATAEYTERTVARAVQVDVVTTGSDTSSDPEGGQHG